MIKISHEKIEYLGGKWVLGRRGKGAKNFEFVSEGTTPSEAFNKSPYSGGVARDVRFDIQISRKEERRMTREEMLAGIKTCQNLIQILKDQISGKAGFSLPGEDRDLQIKYWEAKIRGHEKMISQLRKMLKESEVIK